MRYIPPEVSTLNSKETRRNLASSSPSPQLTQQKRRMTTAMFSTEKRGVLQHISEVSSQKIPQETTFQTSSETKELHPLSRRLYLFDFQIVSTLIEIFCENTDHQTKLFRTRIEPLRKKQVLTEYFKPEG